MQSSGIYNRRLSTLFALNSNSMFYYLEGDLCAAKFVDGQWYRAKVEKVTSSEVSVLYIDYGNRANIPKVHCGTLPGAFVSLPAFAHEYLLALCNLCSDVSIPYLNIDL